MSGIRMTSLESQLDPRETEPNRGSEAPDTSRLAQSRVGQDTLASLERMIGERGNGPAQDKFGMVTVEPTREELHSQRLYLPTLADLIDRLTICQLKAIHIPEHAEDYRREIAMIMHDVDVILGELAEPFDAEALRAIAVVMLTNHFIWINESKARAGGPEQDHLLRVTHSINGVRNTAKNIIASRSGGRKDYKVDTFAADLPAEFKNWNIFQS